VTNDERQERYEAAKEQLLMNLFLLWAEARMRFWLAVPHHHIFKTSAVCSRCYKHMSDLFR